MRAFGETERWFELVQDSDEVYVFRATIEGVVTEHARDMLEFVRAVGQSNGAGLDVRGVGLWMQPAGVWHLDVVLTSSFFLVRPSAVLLPSASDIAKVVMSAPGVKSLFPNAKLMEPELLELVGPAESIDHWRSQPVLWDHNLGKVGGPTDTFAQPADHSIFLGRADDGKLAKPWLVAKPGLAPATPGSTSTPGAPGSTAGKPPSSAIAWLVGAAAAVVGFLATKRYAHGLLRSR